MGPLVPQKMDNRTCHRYRYWRARTKHVDMNQFSSIHPNWYPTFGPIPGFHAIFYATTVGYRIFFAPRWSPAISSRSTSVSVQCLGGHPYYRHFRHRKRNWELRLQGKFKKARPRIQSSWMTFRTVTVLPWWRLGIPHDLRNLKLMFVG